MSDDIQQLEAAFDTLRHDFGRVKNEVERAVVGYDRLITDVLIAICSGGHVLLEGVPGLGKTYLVRVLSEVLELDFGRIQCTPDLMPADVLGTHIVRESADGGRQFKFEKGPVFTNLLLVDEVNRATPKTQSALLEVMQEHRNTVGGDSFTLPPPFFVLATQNPLEMEGTYPLPEAQLDRFLFKLNVRFPDMDALVEISKRTTGVAMPELERIIGATTICEHQKTLAQVPVADPVTRYAAALVLASHPESSDDDNVKRFVSYGASPRGLQALVRGARAHCLLDDRTTVSVEDIRGVAKAALRHRIILNFEGEAESVKVDNLIDDILHTTPAPAETDQT